MPRLESAILVYFKPHIDLSCEDPLVVCHTPLSPVEGTMGSQRCGEMIRPKPNTFLPPQFPRGRTTPKGDKASPNLCLYLLILFPFPPSARLPAFNRGLTGTGEGSGFTSQYCLWHKKLLNNFTVSLLSLGKKVIAL